MEIAQERLKSFIERIERLHEEQAALAEDVKEIYAELKGVGFDAKVVREIVKIRKMDVEKRREFEAVLDLYKSCLGVV